MEGRRPGGLTALAVLNFAGCGFGILGTLARLALVAVIMGFASEAIRKSGDEDAQSVVEAWKAVGVGPVVALAALALVSAVLLLLSGIGYLKQKRFLGRTLGIAYGVFGIVATFVEAAVTPAEANGGFNVMSMISLVYPLLTLLLLNTTFKHDFGS